MKVFKPIDLRATRWELYQEVRHVPFTAGGKMQRTVVLPSHISMDTARQRIDDITPDNQLWTLAATSADNWILRQMILPEAARRDLAELGRLRDLRGGMRAPKKVPLDIFMVHCGETLRRDGLFFSFIPRAAGSRGFSPTLIGPI